MFEANALYSYGYGFDYYSKAQNLQTVSTICLVLGIIGAIVLFFTFLSPRNEGKFTGLLGWLYEFLNFRKFLLEAVLRIIYMILTVFLTLFGFLYIFMGLFDFGRNFLTGLGIMILGNVLIRLLYEACMLVISICKNVAEINRKLGGKPSGVDPISNGSQGNPFQNVADHVRNMQSNFQRPVPPQAPVQGQPPVQNQAPFQRPVPPQAPVQQNQAPFQKPAAPQAPAQNQAPKAPAEGGAMVFCRNCGKQFSADSNVCPHCGTPRRS